MDTSQVEKDLIARIEQSRGWLQGNPSPLNDFNFDNRTWTATPIAFLDNAGRVEQYGVVFEFSLDNPLTPIAVKLSIRIKPEASIGPKADSPPFVVTYVGNHISGADEAVTWRKISKPSSYEDLFGVSIIAWYRHWIEHALVSKSSAKILLPQMNIHD